MAEQDSLSNFDFSKVTKPGKFLKFEAGKAVTLRILTKDPVMQESTFEGDGEVNISTKFCFVVYNFTDSIAQILSAGPGMAKTLQRVAVDEDFGANLQKCDIKITPEGEKLKRVYDINVVRHSGNEKQLTMAMIDEAKAINLDTDIKDNRGRLSLWEPQVSKPASNYEPANVPRTEAGRKVQAEYEDDIPDVVVEDISDEEIDLSDIPF